MKRNRILFYLLLIISTLTLASCHDKLFNYDHIETDGDWGIPIINRAVGLDLLLNRLDSVQYLQTGDDGVFRLIIERDLNDIVSMGHIFEIQDKTYDTIGVVNVETLPSFQISQVLPINLSTESVTLKAASIKSGILTLSFNIPTANFSYSAILTSDNITDLNGNPISLSFSNTQHQQTIDLSNHQIIPNEMGIIIIGALVTVNTNEQVNQITYECHSSLTNFVIHSLTAQFSPISLDLDKTLGFSLPIDKLQFDNIQFNNAKMSLFSKNSLCVISGYLNELSLTGHQGGFHPLISSPVSLYSPISTNQFVQVTETNLQPIIFNSNIDSLLLRSNFTVNPDGFAAGDITVDENSSLSLKIKTEIPTNMSIDNAVYCDTLESSLYQAFNATNPQSIDLLTIRIALTNAYPFDIIPDIEFWNTQTGEKYPLNLNNMHIHGSYNGVPYVNEPYYIEFTNDAAQKIVKSNKVIFKFRITTNGHTVEIKESQYINIAMGARITYTNINF